MYSHQSSDPSPERPTHPFVPLDIVKLFREDLPTTIFATQNIHSPSTVTTRTSLSMGVTQMCWTAASRDVPARPLNRGSEH